MICGTFNSNFVGDVDHHVDSPIANLHNIGGNDLPWHRSSLSECSRILNKKKTLKPKILNKTQQSLFQLLAGRNSLVSSDELFVPSTLVTVLHVRINIWWKVIIYSISFN